MHNRVDEELRPEKHTICSLEDFLPKLYAYFVGALYALFLTQCAEEFDVFEALADVARHVCVVLVLGDLDVGGFFVAGEFEVVAETCSADYDEWDWGWGGWVRGWGEGFEE